MIVLTRPMHTVHIDEIGTTRVTLTQAEALALRGLDVCTVEPTEEPQVWLVSDVSKVGSVVVGDSTVMIRPKVPLRNLVFMASVGAVHTSLLDANLMVDEDAGLPSALASALIAAVEGATRQGLVKGYREERQTALIVRGRWDIARQLNSRPGMPIPLALVVDEFTEDIYENRILHTALRRVLRFADLSDDLCRRANALLVLFSEVGVLPVGISIRLPSATRQTRYLQFPLQIARAILNATSFAQVSGLHRAGTVLVEPAHLFERFVGRGLARTLSPHRYDVDLQDRSSWFDDGRRIPLRPDIVLRVMGEPVAVADTKYKSWGANDGSPPNADIYQAVAYALAFGLRRAHLIYASGEVEPRTYSIPMAGVDIVAHAVSLHGTPIELVQMLDRLAHELLA
ncbi:McrC family protein [Microbacterium luticocti]|uniref:McrC family protein n=1 Tax=Microbacterium luticocti TaxID=451764 RepID=UPI00068810CD|nr:hypothetical protein [Microbacterium luticocti]